MRSEQQGGARGAQLADLRQCFFVEGLIADADYFAEYIRRDIAKDHSVVVVEHDMEFVAKIAHRVTVLHEGSVLAEGSLSQVQSDSNVVEVYLGR